MGYTIDEIAEYLGVTKRTVINWENGDTAPSKNQFQKLNDILALKNDNRFMLNEEIELKTKNIFYNASLGTGSTHILKDAVTSYAAKGNYVLHIGIEKMTRSLQAQYNALNLPYSYFSFSDYSNKKFNPILRDDFVSIMKETGADMSDEKLISLHKRNGNEKEVCSLLPIEECNERCSVLDGNTDFISELKNNKTLFIDLYEANKDRTIFATPVYASWLMTALYHDIVKFSKMNENFMVCIWDYPVFKKYSNIINLVNEPTVKCLIFDYETKQKDMPICEDLTIVKAPYICSETANNWNDLYIETPNKLITTTKFYFGSRFPGLNNRVKKEIDLLDKTMSVHNDCNRKKNTFYTTQVLKLLAEYDLSEQEKMIVSLIVDLKPRGVKDGLLYISEFLDRLVSKESFENKEEQKIARKFSYRQCKKLITIFNSMNLSLRSFAIKKKRFELLFQDAPLSEVFPEDELSWLEKYGFIDWC